MQDLSSFLCIDVINYYFLMSKKFRLYLWVFFQTFEWFNFPLLSIWTQFLKYKKHIMHTCDYKTVYIERVHLHLQMYNMNRLYCVQVLMDCYTAPVNCYGRVQRKCYHKKVYQGRSGYILKDCYWWVVWEWKLECVNLKNDLFDCFCSDTRIGEIQALRATNPLSLLSVSQQRAVYKIFS